MNELSSRGGRSPRDKFVQLRPVPRAVWVAFWALIALAAVALLRYIFQWWNEAEEFGVDLVIARLISLGFLALNVFISFSVRAGRNWARLLLTFLSMISIVDIVVSIVTLNFRSPFVYADLVLSDAAVVLLWLPLSNEFFRQVRADRAQYKSVELTLRGGRPIR